MRGTPTGLIALALVVGAGAGLGAVAFRTKLADTADRARPSRQ